MIIIIGDKPSRKNKSQDVPFVGTKSYSRLLTWIDKLNIDITEVYLGNKSNVIIYNEIYPALQTKKIFIDIDKKYDKVIALGDNASKHLNKLSVEHYKLDHPSGLNRKLNDKQYENAMLKRCSEWLSLNSEDNK